MYNNTQSTATSSESHNPTCPAIRDAHNRPGALRLAQDRLYRSGTARLHLPRETVPNSPAFLRNFAPKPWQCVKRALLVEGQLSPDASLWPHGHTTPPKHLHEEKGIDRTEFLGTNPFHCTRLCAMRLGARQAAKESGCKPATGGCGHSLDLRQTSLAAGVFGLRKVRLRRCQGFDEFSLT